MKYNITKLKKIARTCLQIVVVFGIAAAVLLYVLGYFDVSFLDRESVLGGYNSHESETSAPGVSGIIDLDSIMNETESETANDGNNAESESSANQNQSDNSAAPSAPTNLRKVYDTSELPDSLSTVKAVLIAERDGYSSVAETNDYKPGQTILAKMTFSYKLPTEYSLRTRVVSTPIVTTPEDDSEKIVTLVDTTEDRPAIELYMGYILIDKGENIILSSSDGTPLCRYSPDRFKPAYTRDTSGRPLFVRHVYDSWDDYVGRDVYFYLSDDGKNFVVSDYDPEKDSRGLNFDYPLDYGLTDTNITCTVQEKTDGQIKEEKAKNGLYAYIATNQWGYSYNLTEYQFAKAYNFSEGLGAVIGTETVPEPAEDATDEEKEKYEMIYEGYEPGDIRPADRGSLYFVNSNGRRVFQTVKNYYRQDYLRYVTDYFMPPITTGIESIGYFYFENGLCRIRRQTIDYYNWENRRSVRVIADEEILIRADGTEYELPSGFSLEGYSDGMILLRSEHTGLCGFIDCTGEWIAQPIFADGTPFIEGLATLTTADGRVGMIDREGNIVLAFTYDSISQVSGGRIAAYRSENGWSIFKMMEKQ